MEIRANCKLPFVSTENLVKSIFRKIKKTRKVRQNQKTLISASVNFLRASAKSLFMQWRFNTRLWIFPYFLKS